MNGEPKFEGSKPKSEELPERLMARLKKWSELVEGAEMSPEHTLLFKQAIEKIAERARQEILIDGSLDEKNEQGLCRGILVGVTGRDVRVRGILDTADRESRSAQRYELKPEERTVADTFELLLEDTYK